MGPVEYLVVAFPGNKFNGDIVPALAELTEQGVIHIIDLVFIRKDADGNVASAELEDLPADVAAAFEGVDGEVSDLVNAEDIAFAAEGLDPDSSAGLLVYENVWSTRFRDAVVGSGGQLVDRGYIPAETIAAALEAAQAGNG
jgi:Family of unknown function (DUF6325)